MRSSPLPNESGALRIEIRGDDVTEPSLAAEIVSLTLFDLQAQAVGDDPSGVGPTLVAGFASVALAEDAQAVLSTRHNAFIVTMSVERVEPAHWVEAQRAGLQPTTVGAWHIRAPWHPEPTVEPLLDIVIDPGVAFGHGAHPTTRLVLELMLRHVDAGVLLDRVVDLGTGTGVAALVAARSGASVLAVENDAGACEVAWHNIERNSTHPFESTADRIELVHGDAADIDVSDGDLVVANVTLDVQRAIAPTCASADRIVVSGILCNQVRAMQDLYPTHRASTIRTTGEWAGIDFLSRSPRCRKKRNE